ncbi:cell adhesion molecule CEACAM20-like [Odontesthes bonariensis]|uniref:cell adhesion molecule CEACAM20-like n=1 Tax=Odontesthes bonariensis TaxID=219752 RepID=UPI003F58CE08
MSEMDLFALKSLFFLLSFTGFCVGQDVLPEGPLDAGVGQNVTVKILIENDVGDDIIWNFSDGDEQINVATLRQSVVRVATPYKGRASIDPKTGYLTLTSLQSKDSGDYSVTILGNDGTKTGEVKVRVLEPVTQVVIKSDLAEAIEHNSSVVLTCSAKGSYLKFTWTQGTKPFVIDGIRLTQTNKEFSSELTIRTVHRSDLVGPIFCIVKNPLEEGKSSPFNLTVHYGPDAVTIAPLKPPQYIKSKSDFNLTCTATSSPSATFTWYHNEDLMKASGPVLTLKAIQEEGFGKKLSGYSCEAKNTKTLRSMKSPVVTFSVMEPISGTNITGPIAVLIAGNGTANLSCQAKTGEVKERVWLKDGQKLSASARVVFSGDMSSVVINSLLKEDNGKYTCKLNNPVNEEEAVYNMVVNYGPESVEVRGEEEVEVNTDVKLTCSSSSIPPATFTWKINGTVTSVVQKEYTITPAFYKDSGLYTCEAYNAITGKTVPASHKLSVKADIDDGLSDGAIAGIVIACLVVVGVAIGLFMYCRQKIPTESPY